MDFDLTYVVMPKLSKSRLNEPTNILIFQNFADPSYGNVYIVQTK